MLIILSLLLLFLFKNKRKTPGEIIPVNAFSSVVSAPVQEERNGPPEPESAEIVASVENVQEKVAAAPINYPEDFGAEVTEIAEITGMEENVVRELIEESRVVAPPIRYIPPVADYLVLLSGGSFSMGSPNTEEDRLEDEYTRDVNIKSFYISRYEVSQRQFQEIMGRNPSYHSGPNLPVENVSWFDAVEYCNALSVRDRLQPAYTIISTGYGKVVLWNRNSLGYRLPTEAEWEYACRAGTNTAYNTGDNISRNAANYYSNRTRNVGSYRANNFGLYDTHGNVAEWCWDIYTSYGVDTRNVIERREIETPRVFRGGSWFNSSGRLRSAFRDSYYPSYKGSYLGFRVARSYYE